ncbi:MAG: NTP transferase domain-containing protein, partial [Gammaproteobacteria bacterium]
MNPPAVNPLDIVVLAGDRGPDDPLCRAAGVPAKALVPIGGLPVLARVLRVLSARAEPGARIVCGPTREALDAPCAATEPTDPATLTDWLAATGFRWVAPAGSPAASALLAVRATTGEGRLLLLTTGDHALLTDAIVSDFLAGARAAQAEGADLAVGFVPLARVLARFPDARRTPLRFRDGAVCTCNLFALLRPTALGVIELWRRVEQDRKQPWKIVRLLGPVTLLRYVLGRVTLAEVLARLGRITGTRIAPVMLEHATAAVDVDSPADW